MPIKKLLKKDTTLYWNEDFQKSLDILKENMVIAPILVFLDWSKEFHVHIDASCIALGDVLAESGLGDIDHPISFFNSEAIKC